MNESTVQPLERKKSIKNKIMIGTLIYITSLLASYMVGAEANEDIEEKLNMSGYELQLNIDKTDPVGLVGLVPGVAPISAACFVYQANCLNDEEYKAKYIEAALIQGKVKAIK
jgi:hypothetical protein